MDIIHATRDRAGMIVLVTLTTIASLVPMAWGTGSDTMFGAIALATAGGTVAGTLAALWLLPAHLFGRLRPRWRRRPRGGGGPGRLRRLLGPVGRVLGRFRRRPAEVTA
jgi:hypothetical protein